MRRLSSNELLTLAALLVALILGLVLFAELPAIISAARPQATPAPATPGTPAPTPAPPTRGTFTVASDLFKLQAPAGWHYSLRTSGAGSSNSAALYATKTQDPTGNKSPVAGTLQPQASQSQQLSEMEQTYGSVGTCVAASTMTVGGVSGLVAGYQYSLPVNGLPTPVCDVYWVGAKESAKANYTYTVKYAVPMSGYPQFAPLAEQARASLTWFV